MKRERLVGVLLGIMVAVGAIGATTDQILRDVFDDANDAFRVIGISGSSLVTGSGTANRLAKFSSASTLADSLLSDDGTNVTLTSGQLLVPDGTKALPGAAFGSDPDTGIYRRINDFVMIAGNGKENAQISANGMYIVNSLQISGNDLSTTSPDIILSRAAANVLQLASGDSFAFGGITTSFPRLKNSGSDLQVRLGDDSGYAAIDVGSIKVGGSAVKTVSTFTSDAAYDPASLSGGSSRIDDVAVTGVVANRAVICTPRTFTNFNSCIYNCRSDVNDNVEVHWYNGDDGVGGASCDPDSSTWDFMQPAS